MAIAYKHLSDRVPSPSSVMPTVPTAFDGFIESATDPDREMRPESAAAMRLDLATFSATLERARTLASLVNDVPRVVRDPVSGEATATIRLRRSPNPSPRSGGIDAVAAAASSSACSRCSPSRSPPGARGRYVIPHSHPIPSVVGLPHGRGEPATARPRLHGPAR